MHDVFNTMQDLMAHSKNVTYVLMGLALLGMLGFWLFLIGRDTKTGPQDPHAH
jgi:hypothetical protein